MTKLNLEPHSLPSLDPKVQKQVQEKEQALKLRHKKYKKNGLAILIICFIIFSFGLLLKSFVPTLRNSQKSDAIQIEEFRQSGIDRRLKLRVNRRFLRISNHGEHVLKGKLFIEELDAQGNSISQHNHHIQGLAPGVTYTLPLNLEENGKSIRYSLENTELDEDYILADSQWPVSISAHSNQKFLTASFTNPLQDPLPPREYYLVFRENEQILQIERVSFSNINNRVDAGETISQSFPLPSDYSATNTIEFWPIIKDQLRSSHAAEEPLATVEDYRDFIRLEIKDVFVPEPSPDAPELFDKFFAKSKKRSLIIIENRSEHILKVEIEFTKRVDKLNLAERKKYRALEAGRKYFILSNYDEMRIRLLHASVEDEYTRLSTNIEPKITELKSKWLLQLENSSEEPIHPSRYGLLKQNAGSLSYQSFYFTAPYELDLRSLLPGDSCFKTLAKESAEKAPLLFEEIASEDYEHSTDSLRLIEKLDRSDYTIPPTSLPLSKEEKEAIVEVSLVDPFTYDFQNPIRIVNKSKSRIFVIGAILIYQNDQIIDCFTFNQYIAANSDDAGAWLDESESLENALAYKEAHDLIKEGKSGLSAELQYEVFVTQNK